MVHFNLWLEFWAVGGPWNTESDFANIRVSLTDGRHYRINVWAYDFFKKALEGDIEEGNNLNGRYIVPPDLFVQELTRECIQATIADLLQKDDLERVLNPSIIAT